MVAKKLYAVNVAITFVIFIVSQLIMLYHSIVSFSSYRIHEHLVSQNLWNRI